MIRKILKKSWKSWEFEKSSKFEKVCKLKFEIFEKYWKILKNFENFEKSWKIWNKITWKFWNNEKMIQKGFWDFRIWKIGEKIEKFESPLPGKNPSLELRYAS